MTLHPPGSIGAIGKPAEPATRIIRQAWGMPVSAAHTRRPRILRLEPSKPKGSNVGAGQ